MPTEPFNRTIVELKLYIALRYHITSTAFNRTIVELKYVPFPVVTNLSHSFNRTIVELKLREIVNFIYDDYLLIVP